MGGIRNQSKMRGPKVVTVAPLPNSTMRSNNRATTSSKSSNDTSGIRQMSDSNHSHGGNHNNNGTKQSTRDGSNSNSNANANSNPAWMDWIESCGAELFGLECEGYDIPNCTGSGGSSRSVLGDAARLQNVPHNQNAPGAPLNLEFLHDEFLESLLLEQHTAVQSDDRSSNTQKTAKANSTADLKSNSWSYLENSSSMSVDSSKTNESENVNGASPRKRRRPGVKLHQRKSSPQRIRRGKVAPNNNSNNNKDDSSNQTINLAELSRSDFPDPSTYLHPLCRMQKDKGKGEAVGSSICAKGRDACLEKLRTKMQLLTEIAFSGTSANHNSSSTNSNGNKTTSASGATMQRRKARISERCENFTETRSMIELRMGFLSMQYGVLLRWDTSRTGQVTLVVLRKLCHASFYPPTKRSVQLQQQQQQQLQQPLNHWHPQEPVHQVRDVVGDKHAIIQRPDGTEVTLLEPPYRVRRPEQFQPTVLEVSVLFASGLSRKSNWTAQLSYDNSVENILLSWDPDMSCLCPNKLGEVLKHDFAKSQDLDLSCLEIKLFEHRLRRKVQRRLVSTMKVPLANLKAQPSVGGKPSRMKIPCQDDHNASIVVDLHLKSDYAHWLNKELDARRREEVSGFVWRASYFVPEALVVVEEEEEEAAQENDPWEWICSVC
jgi:hypothetical protein